MSDEPMRIKGDGSARAEHNRKKVICAYCGATTGRYACAACDLPAEIPSFRIMDGWLISTYQTDNEKRLRWAVAEIRRLRRKQDELEAHIRDSETGRIEASLHAEVLGFICERDEARAEVERLRARNEGDE